MKRKIKRLAQHLAAATGRQSTLFRGRNALLVLMYHRILPRTDPRHPMEQPGMIVEPDTFRMHLRELRRLFTPVSLSEWITKARNGESLPAKAVAITFDDGWRDNYEYAYPHLQAESFPATIFLVSDLIGTRRTFWPEQLMKILVDTANSADNAVWTAAEFRWLADLDGTTTFADRPPTVDELDAVVRQAKRFSEETLYAHIDAMSALIPAAADQPIDILDWDQIREMDGSGLISFGSHTRNHTRMSNGLSHDLMWDEVVGSKKRLEESIGKPIGIFCYPNGDITESAARLVSEHYDASLTTQTGWNNSGNIDFHRLKRIGIHQDIAVDKTAFLARLSGWL